MSILQFEREQVKAMAQSGLMNIKSLEHWDICHALQSGKSVEIVADEFRLSFSMVAHIRKKKCNC